MDSENLHHALTWLPRALHTPFFASEGIQTEGWMQDVCYFCKMPYGYVEQSLAGKAHQYGR